MPPSQAAATPPDYFFRCRARSPPMRLILSIFFILISMSISPLSFALPACLICRCRCRDAHHCYGYAIFFEFSPFCPPDASYAAGAMPRAKKGGSVERGAEPPLPRRWIPRCRYACSYVTRIKSVRSRLRDAAELSWQFEEQARQTYIKARRWQACGAARARRSCARRARLTA